jgi:hypothetical protein
MPLAIKKRRNSPPSTITPHLVGWTPTVQNNLPALYRTSYKTLPKASYIEHLAGTKKLHRQMDYAVAAELTVGLGDLQRLPGFLQ